MRTAQTVRATMLMAVRAAVPVVARAAVLVALLAWPVAASARVVGGAGAAPGPVQADAGGARAPARLCRTGDLQATYTVVPFSQGAGSESYLLTVRNRSPTGCKLEVPAGMSLLDRRLRPLPTNAHLGGRPVMLAAGQWAQAQAQLSEDVAAAGEPPGRCEPVAHWLALRIGHGRLLAAMDPTRVCQHGTMHFGRLRVIALTPPCAARALSASFTRLSAPLSGRVNYRLAVHNNQRRACHVSAVVGLRLLAAGGRALPTHVISGVRYPYVIAGRARAVAAATLFTTAGRGEPRRGPCEPLAVQVAIHPGLANGRLRTAIRPPLAACHHGTIVLSALFGCCLGRVARATPAAGRAAWPAGRASQPAGRASQPAGRADRPPVRLVFVRGLRHPSVWLAGAEGAGAHRLAAGELPRLSPNGRVIVYGRCSGPNCQESLLVAAIDGGRPRTVAHDWQGIGTFAFSPNSRMVATVIGPPLGRQRLVLINLASGAQHTIATGCPGCFAGVSFAPNSRQLVYALRRSERSPDHGDLYRVDGGGGAPVQITRDHRALDPLWGPGGRIVFAHLGTHTQSALGEQLAVISPDGLHLRQLTHMRVAPRLAPLMFGLVPTQWSANGGRLLAEFLGTDTDYAVAVNPRSGAQRTVLARRQPFVGWALSANGRMILGVLGGLQTGRLGNVVAVPYRGGAPRVLARNAGEPDWSR